MMGVFTELNTQGLPFVYPQMFLVSNINYETAGEYTVKITVLDPNRATIKSESLQVVAKENGEEVGIIINLLNAEFKMSGEHIFLLDIGNDVSKEIYLKVKE